METLLADLSRIAATLSTVPGLSSGHDGVVLYLKEPGGSYMEVVADDDAFLSWQCNWQRAQGAAHRNWELQVSFVAAAPDARPAQLPVEAILCNCFCCRDLRLRPAWRDPKAVCAGVPPEFSALPHFRPCPSDGRQL